MLKIALVSMCVVAVVSATLMHHYIPALIVGIAAGIVFFVMGFLSGQGLSDRERFGRRPGDVTTRIGISLAAAGIASGAMDPARHFPDSFRVFYGVCLAVAGIGALVLAARKESGPDASAGRKDAKPDASAGRGGTSAKPSRRR